MEVVATGSSNSRAPAQPPEKRPARRRFGSVLRQLRRAAVPAALVAAGLSGCISKQANLFKDESDREHYRSVAARVDFPELEVACEEPMRPGLPHTLDDISNLQYRDMTLDEAIRYALENSDVLRDLGGTVLRSPDLILTKYGVSIQNTDPRFGAEAALSAFDAQLSGSAFFQKNDRRLNNTFFGGGTRVLLQDRHDYQAQLSKLSATGAEFAVRSLTDYDNNNAPGNAFPHAWTQQLEGEVRQPLLQGAGVEFNRIAGPSRVPGLINGVMVARVNNKITQTEFELQLRDYVSNVENAYWDLYFAYRNLEARIQARDQARRTWETVQANRGRQGYEADKEALAREQYYRFQEEVQNAVNGLQEDGTRTRNGTTGGSFRGTGGVLLTERRLRLIMGVPITEERLIRPSDEPEMANLLFDWDSLVAEAQTRRPELKRQRLIIERREMEWLANRNFLNPRLDAVGLYRFRGFGRDYLTQTGSQSAWDELTDGDFQEWQVGVELNMPIGFRQAHAAVQNSELLLAKERAVLREQERQVSHDLSNALGELERAYETSQTNLNRFHAAWKYLQTLESRQKSNLPVDIYKILDAQNRVAGAQTRYFLSRVSYALAIKNMNFEKGSLMDYHGIYSVDGYIEADTGSTTEPVPMDMESSKSIDEQLRATLLERSQAAPAIAQPAAAEEAAPAVEELAPASWEDDIQPTSFDRESGPAAEAAAEFPAGESPPARDTTDKVSWWRKLTGRGSE